MQDYATIKNAKGDNSQVFSKKNSNNIYQKEMKWKQESLKKLKKYESDDVSLKLVPLHIYDVINALKQVKESSITALRSKNRIKLKHPNKGKISHRVKKFYYSEDTSQVSDDKRSEISDFVEELNLQYIRKCESEMRRARRIKRRRAVGHHYPRKWSQSQIRHYMRLSEKNCSRSKRHSWSTRSFRSGRSDGRSSLTLLSFLPAEQVENQINIEKMRLRQKKKDRNSSKNKQDSLLMKKDKKRRDGLDFDENLVLPDGDSPRGRKIKSKSYTIHKEVHSNLSKEKRHPERRCKGMYISRSQEDTYEALTKRRSMRKNQNHEHSRKDKINGRKERSKLTKKNSGSTDGQRDKHRIRFSKIRRSKKEKHGSMKVQVEQEREEKNNEDQAETILDKTSAIKAENDGKTLSGKSLIDFSERSYKRDYMENNCHGLTHPIQNLNQRILTENYQRIMMSDSDIPNVIERGTENGDTGANKSDSNSYFETKVGTNTRKNLQINGQTGHLRKSEMTLLPQNSKIIFKIDTNQLQKMSIMVGDSRCYKKSSNQSINKTEKDHLTESCSLNIIPSDTFNKRYKKNRLNNNFGILSRISVPEFHQKEVLMSKNSQHPKDVSSRSALHQKKSKEKQRPNNPLKNMLLTQIVRQNSSLSLKDEGKVELKKTYMFNELSSDMYSQPQNISDLYSTDQTPNFAPLSDPLSTQMTDTEGNYMNSEANKWRRKQQEDLQADDDSDSEVTESLIIATMSRRQLGSTKLKRYMSKARSPRTPDQDSEESETQYSEPGTFYQRSGHPCKERKKSYRPSSVRSRVTCRSFPRSIWQGKNKNCGDKKQRMVHEKSNTSNEENIENQVGYITQEKQGDILKTGGKCAVRGCNKAAVARTERVTERNERNQAENNSQCRNQNNNDKSGNRKMCSHKKDSQKTDQINKKICILCTAPLIDQNIAKRLPPNEHLIAGDNLKFLENLCIDEAMPHFRSPSQEDFQHYIDRMRPCLSAFHHTSQAAPMKKYHSSPITAPFAHDYSPNKSITQPRYWDPEFSLPIGHDFQCMTSRPSCAYHPFSDTDTLAYYCTENTNVLDPQQVFDYSAPNSEFEPLPFMQSAGPLTDMNGRPLLILDNEGQPIFDYTGEPIVPETYMQAEGLYPYDPQFQISNSQQLPPIQNSNQTGKLSRFFGFR